MTKPRSVLLIVCFALYFAANTCFSANLPPPPTQPFADYVEIVSKAAAQDINRILTEFERTSSCQVVVAVYDRLPQGEALEDYANRVFNAWEIGQKNKNNGVLMLIFIKDRKIRIEVGYGLEGVLPDAIAKRIISERIAPRFRGGDYYGGIKAGIQGIIAAIGGEYKSSGPTSGHVFDPILVFALIFTIIVVLSFFQKPRYVYTGSGVRRYRTGYGGGWSGGGGGWSGGGGHSGGGGASGGW